MAYLKLMSPRRCGIGLFSATLLLPMVAGAQDKPTGTARQVAAGAAMTCSAKSPKHTVALVELFTSEGCSSCPPADRWLQSLPRSGFGFEKVVPLSLHVGYWDYIGWKDPYAQQRFTDRQREYARFRQSNSVYTPQVVLAGSDFRGWGDSSLKRELSVLANRSAVADIELEAAVVGSTIQVKTGAQLDPASKAGASAPQLHLAVFEMGLKNKVTRGENSGETLTHDFVVRQWQGPLPLVQGKLAAKELIALAAPSAGRSLGVAAFVQGARGEVLQATACVMR